MKQEKRLSEVAIKLFDAICDVWGLDPDQKARLAGTSDLSQISVNGALPAATLERLSYIAGIQKSLEILFEQPEARSRWIHQPNDGFQGQSALNVMLSGPSGLHRVRLYLDAWRQEQYL